MHITVMAFNATDSRADPLAQARKSVLSSCTNFLPELPKGMENVFGFHFTTSE